MLKHPFHKFLYAAEDGQLAFVLMLGHCTADNVCSISNTLEQQARLQGGHIEESCFVVILYLGPDAVPPTYTVVLPDGKYARIVTVTNGENISGFFDVVRVYVRLMEEIQHALQLGMSRDYAAKHYWQLYLDRCSASQIPICFVCSEEEFRQDIFTLHAMLEEQELLSA